MLRILLAAKSPLCHPLQSIPVNYFSSHIFLKNKTKGTLHKVYQKPINLKAEKEKLLHGTQESPTVDANSLAATPLKKSQKFKATIEHDKSTSSDTNEEIAKEIPASSSEKAVESFENRALVKEKELSMRFLKARTKEDIYKLYEKSVLQIKPLHLSIALFQVIKLTRLENKLKAMVPKKSTNMRPNMQVGLWEDENFLNLYRVALENIENMNPDSLIKLLAAIKLKKGENQYLKALYDHVIDWLAKDQNVLLFDRIQTVKLLVIFSKLAAKRSYYNPKNMQLYKLMSGKLRTEIKDLRTINVLQIYRSCLKLKYFDPKLFTHLNAQIRKRIKYVYPKDLIACCAANIACKSQDSEAFAKSMLTHIQRADLIGTLRPKDLVNLLVLTYEALKLDFTPEFKTEINGIADRTMDRFMLQQRKFIAYQKQQIKPVQEGEDAAEESVKEEKSLSIFYINNFLKNLMLLGRYDQSVVAFIQDLFVNKCVMGAKDTLFVIIYTLQVRQKTNLLQDSDVEDILIPSFVSLEKNLTRISVEDLDLTHHILQTLLQEEAKLNHLFMRSREFTAKFQLIVRRFIHALIQANHALPWSMLMKEYTFFEKHSEIKIQFTQFAALDFYARSVRRNILQPLLVSAAEVTEEAEEQSETSIRLKLDERQRGSVVNNLWMLSNVMSQEYPIIENAAIFQEFAQILYEQVQLKDLTIDQLDKLIEIKSLFDNSLGQNPITQALNSSEVEDIIIDRFNSLKENALKRRKNVREELEALSQEILGADNLVVKQNSVLPEDVLADLLVTKGEKKYVVMFYSHAGEHGLAKLDHVLEGKAQKILYSPMKDKVLKYKGYNPVWINVKEWINFEANDKKTRLEELYKA